MLTLALDIQPVKSESGTIYIRADGSVDPPTAPISTADHVTYTLTAEITSSGDGIIVERDNITIDGNGYALLGSARARGNEGLNLYNVTNVTIRNANIKYFYFGIYLNLASHSVVRDSVLTDNEYGIEFKSSSQNVIHGNKIENNTYGIYYEGGLPFSSDNEIYDNRIASNTWESVHVRYSSNNQIYENNITDNGEGIVVEGDFLSEASHNLVSRNNITANGAGSFGAAIKLGPYSNYNIVQRNIIINSGSITLYASSNNRIHENVMANSSGHGLNLVFSSKQNSIQRNNLTNNRIGIEIGGFLSASYKECPENNTICENNIANSRENGTRLGGSLNSVFYHNNFQNNTQQISIADPNATSIWDNGYPSGGNYWSDYAGADDNGDGIGDSPYVIDEDNRDRYPLMDSWSQSEQGPITPPSSEVKIGVKAGDWIKCTYTISGWPAGTPYPVWLKVEFLSVEGTAATVRVTMHMSDGSEQNATVPVDVVAGGQALGLSGFIIPANSTTGDSINFGGFGLTSSATIEGETTRAYAGMSRTVVYASFSQLGTQLTYYWDKQTGVMVEVSTTSGSISGTGKATETNMWAAVSSPFWMQWWFYAIVAVVVVALGGAVYFLKKRKPQTPTTPPLPTDRHLTEFCRAYCTCMVTQFI